MPCSSLQDTHNEKRLSFVHMCPHISHVGFPSIYVFSNLILKACLLYICVLTPHTSHSLLSLLYACPVKPVFCTCVLTPHTALSPYLLYACPDTSYYSYICVLKPHTTVLPTLLLVLHFGALIMRENGLLRRRTAYFTCVWCIKWVINQYNIQQILMSICIYIYK